MHFAAECGVKSKEQTWTQTDRIQVPAACAPREGGWGGLATSCLKAATSSSKGGRVLEGDQSPWARSFHYCLPRGWGHSAGLPLPA